MFKCTGILRNGSIVYFYTLPFVFNMQKLYLPTLFTLLCLSVSCYGQSGYFTGSLQTNTNFFIRDVKIGAYNMPQYDNLKVGTDAWFNLNYTNEKYDLDAGVRFDFFYNSILRVPTSPYTAAGVGNFYVRKKIKDLTVTAGYIYDQIGSGIIYRAYEERELGIDNALLGARAEYNLASVIRLKAFAGVQKLEFSYQNPIILGFNADANLKSGETQFNPGIGVINRSMDQASMNEVVATIETYDTTGRFVPKYNTYAFTFYNTIAGHGFSWYVEAAYKTAEAIRAPQITEVVDSLIYAPGTCFYTALNYSKKGFGATLQFKRTQNFYLHTSPNPTASQFDGEMSFIPPVSRENSLALPSRYYAQSLENHELAFSGETTYSPVERVTITLSGSFIRDFLLKSMGELTNTPFFGEAFGSVLYRPTRYFETEIGFQYVRYNKFVYQNDGPTNVDAYTPFSEFLFKFTHRYSLRIEVQYQNVKLDYGQWLYGLAEFNIAPHLSIAATDMWNFQPNPEVNPYPNHYYSFFVGYTQGSTAFTLAWVKQVEGIVCTGGVCRIEPAFSGVKFGITSTF